MVFGQKAKDFILITESCKCEIRTWLLFALSSLDEGTCYNSPCFHCFFSLRAFLALQSELPFISLILSELPVLNDSTLLECPPTPNTQQLPPLDVCLEGELVMAVQISGAVSWLRGSLSPSG